ncbi:MAG TPA: CDP-diacylglycerol--glycerol-3-phosphate 3-phosphatidyltransferase [Pirellulales bacterium]|jgi:CDP-diacylglycerol--glycerol-3-phosphate 3-phosphatidyltransferase|nr:CDP-diacylglycerol--glycerol-3-phosphate 3-phosphatidyltransferase [Pirellulales bacterium]
MSTSTEKARPPLIDFRKAFNVPNQLTTIRLLLGVVLFCLIGFDYYLPAMYVFIVAAGTDWVDGFYARRYNQVTTLGRILDPFADKIIICGTFIFLAALSADSKITSAMAVIVVGRELLVTVLRSFLEQHGSDFSAKMSGKLKMVLQCVACAVSLFALSYLRASPPVAPPAWVPPTLLIAVWSAVVLTVISGIVYVFAAIKLLRQ